MKYKLLAQGGYGNIYIDPSRSIICKRVPKQTHDSCVMFSTVLELIASSAAQSMTGTPHIRNVGVDADHADIYMEYHGHTLNRWITSHGDAFIPAGLATIIMRSLVSTLMQLKAVNILHTDIKPCNILINKAAPLRVTLVDYNCASVAEVDYGFADGRPKVVYSNAMATYNFAAPELVFEGHPTPTSSCWSLALIACMLFGGEYPISATKTHDKKNQWYNTQAEWKDILRSLQQGHAMVVPQHILSKMGNNYKLTAWVSQAFAWEPSHRPSLEDIALSVIGAPLPKTPLPVVEPVAYPSNIELRTRILERYYNIAIDTHAQAWFTTAVFILDAAGGPLGCTENLYAAACWVIAGCLHNCYVLDEDAQVERLLYYFHERVEAVSEHIWKIGQAKKWNLWGRPLDVVLIEDHGLHYSFSKIKDIMMTMNRPWTPTTYATILALQSAAI